MIDEFNWIYLTFYLFIQTYLIYHKLDMKPAEILLALALPVLIASLSFHQAATTTPENST